MSFQAIDKACRIAAIAVALAVGVMASGARAESAALTVTAAETTVDVANVSPGGSVVLLSCIRGSRQGHTSVASRGILLRDDDGDGKVRYEPTEGIPLRSVWVAVEYSSGRVTTATRSGFAATVLPLPNAALRKDAENALAFLEQEMPTVIVFLVRPPSGGVWQFVARDGQASDHDGSPNGRLKLAFEDARTIDGRDKAPKHLKNDDVIVAFDPGYLDAWIIQVGK